jgi:hypothetical protein
MFRQELDGCLGRNMQHPVPADKYRKEDEYAAILLANGEALLSCLGVRIMATSLGPLIAATTRINIGAPV